MRWVASAYVLKLTAMAVNVSTIDRRAPSCLKVPWQAQESDGEMSSVMMLGKAQYRAVRSSLVEGDRVHSG